MQGSLIMYQAGVYETWMNAVVNQGTARLDSCPSNHPTSFRSHTCSMGVQGKLEQPIGNGWRGVKWLTLVRLQPRLLGSDIS